MGAGRLDVDAEHARVGVRGLDGRAVDERAAGGRAGDPDDRLQRRRLARSVRSQEAGHRTRAHAERQVVDRRELAVALRQALDRDGGLGLFVDHAQRIEPGGVAVIAPD